MTRSPIEASQALGRLLDNAIDDLSLKKEHSMRGLARLANASEHLTKSLDDAADQAAERIEKAVARGQDTVRRFNAYADQVEASADEAEKVLGQLSNMLPLPDSDGSSGERP